MSANADAPLLITGHCRGCGRVARLTVGSWSATAGTTGLCAACLPAGPIHLVPPRLPFRLISFPLAKAVCAQAAGEPLGVRHIP